jgi:7-cyano-7-deazaguanine synthase in queuosine biosynthesis
MAKRPDSGVVAKGGKQILVFGRAGKKPLPPSLRRRREVVTVDIGEVRRPGTFRSDVERLRSIAGEGWNRSLFDLLTVACALRAADRFYPSGGVFENARRMSVAATVLDVKRWRAAVTTLQQAVFLLSNDALCFYPVSAGRKLGAAEPLPSAPWASAIRQYSPDAVCLFSGGADSFCGAAHLLHAGRRPLLVCQSVGPVSRRQRELFAALQARFPQLGDAALAQVRAFPNAVHHAAAGRRIWRQQDDLQRLRSMFFFSLAAIVARAHGIDEIFMCENGIIGAAIIFAPALDSPYTTRPAEPHYLRAMESVLRLALDAPSLRLRNPFQYSTKGEVLRRCADLGLVEALYRTVSCWGIGNRGVQNCGVCVPCMFRQLAFAEAGLPSRRREYRRAEIPRRAWRRWRSPNLHHLLAVRDYCEQAGRDGRPWLLGCESAVADAVDVTAGPAARLAVDKKKQKELDDRSGEIIAETVLRFARATLERLH